MKQCKRTILGTEGNDLLILIQLERIICYFIYIAVNTAYILYKQI